MDHEDPTCEILDELWGGLPGDDVLWESVLLINDVAIDRRAKTSEWLYVVFPLETVPRVTKLVKRHGKSISEAPRC